MRGSTEGEGLDHLGEVAMDFAVPVLVGEGEAGVEDVEERAARAVLEDDEDAFLLLRVDGLAELDDVGVAEAEEQIDLGVDHLGELALLEEVLLLDLLEPQDLHRLPQTSTT